MAEAPVPVGLPRVPAQTRVPADAVRNVRVGRQGLYDARRTLVAYEVLFHSGEKDVSDRATSQVIASTFGTFGVDRIAGSRPVFISFTRAFLTGVIPIPVEPAGVVVEISATMMVDAELLAGVEGLRHDGYRIALCDYRGQPECSALLDLVDYVKVDVPAHPGWQLAELAARVTERGRDLIAGGIEDEPTLARVLELGFGLFQGPLLEKPTVLERRTLTPTQLVCVRLLRELADPELDIIRLEPTIGSDPGLALRLLRTANSAASGTMRQVSSLRQALVIIGPRRLRSWVVLILLEGPSNASPADGLWKVLARACACRVLAPDPVDDMAFTVGLLSGAAELLATPPEVVAEAAGVSREVRDALVSGLGGAGAALHAVLAHERDDDEGIAATGLAPYAVSHAYLESLSESLRLVEEIAGVSDS
ncbi:EAL and HDOD domain-containing protein [Kineosporia succinea]|uniref:EAL and modified HD-GYP domain-containing signal transduction protein n=1 Tax=Kineosporia succinea TaxID=84632 RepID=A0ABT9P1C6_9ACTN|nr:HDOD domain-containing protein [Kineosporia succinea]MDP9826478.1 EAL and modified HD-GYP domain-containing signal transduction protein [Kineosporia succinea]